MISEKGLDAVFQHMKDGSAMLLYGPSGYGKTYQVQRLAKEFCVPICSSPQDIETESILFIDEIQMVSLKDQNHFLNLIDNPYVYKYTSSERDSYHFKVIMATTDPDKVLPAILTRSYKFQFSPYDVAEIADMILKKVDVTRQDAEDIARRCKLIPREAVHFAELASCIGIQDAFKHFNIDDNGLTDYDRTYLSLLATRGRMSLNDLASAMTVTRGTIEQIVEPYLKRMGWVQIDSSGRDLTNDGRRFVRKEWQ